MTSSAVPGDHGAQNKDASPRPLAALGPVEGACIVVGTVIGSGVFIVPQTVAAKVGEYGFGMVMLAWIVGGVLSLAGALSYAELAAMFPRSGGQYVFLSEAFGRFWGFLYGWVEFWVARAGSIAALAVAFARYAGHFTRHEGEWGTRWTAFLVIFVLTLVNYLGVRWGGTVQVVFTATKVGALIALTACAFGLPIGDRQNLEPVWRLPEDGWEGLVPAFGAAMIAVLWAYDGWSNGAAVAEEMKHPKRDAPRALAFGTLTLTAIYLLANLGYHYVLPMESIVAEDRVAGAVAGALFGPIGAGLLAAAVMISTFGAVNGLLLTGPRIFYAMSRDGVFFRNLGHLHERFRTPHLAIVFQGMWAAFLVLVPFNEVAERLFGWNLTQPLYDQLFTYVMFVSWLFYGLSVVGLIVLRVRRPDLPRPYRVPGYPVVPMLFVLASVAFVVHTLYTQRVESLGGLLILLLGIPAYWSWKRGGDRL